MNISKSKIKTLQECPLRFKFQYIDYKIPEVPKADVTQIGIDMHEIFKKFFDNIEILNIPQNVYEYFCNSMKVAIQYKKMFNNFCKVQADIYNILEDKKYFMPVMREQKISINDMRGIVDRVDFDGEHYSVIDYKSNVSNESQLRFELCFYKYLVDQSNKLDMPIEYIGSYGYRDGGIFFEKINTRSYNLMLKKVEAFRELDFSNFQFEPKEGYSCRWCEWPRSCKLWKEQRRF